ncbi:MAG: hypothetical protein KAG84_02625 [Bacteroidales bacterium]|nr:hypothetical protein [Bacteroidales bacterium]
MRIIKRIIAFGFIIGLLNIAFLSQSCNKDDGFAEGNISLGFSTDTILFDTLFTTIGSSTYTLLVRNKEDKPVNISQLFIAGGANSPYRMNVDGISGYLHTNVEIAANDSMYIFVEVTIDPNSGVGPMLVTDSIIFETNGNIQDVDLIAFGVDAYFIVPNLHISGLPPINIVAREGVDTTWTNDKPIVIYGYAVVDSTASLTIESGTEIYFHSGGGLWVYKGGNIKINGTLNEPVTFQGDRPEDYYKNLPGQWDRIWINEGSADNVINYAIIRNGFIGLQTELLSSDMGNKNIISNTIIENMSGVGILNRAHSIDGENILINNCKQYCLAITMGGEHEFRHCTFANYWSYDTRKTPTVYINNYYKDHLDQIHPFDLEANFYNSIVYGNNEEEILVDNNTSGGNFDFVFDHGLIKSQQDISDATLWISVIKNDSPDFENTSNTGDYHIGENSAAIDAGKAGIAPTLDLDGVSRDAATPDLGVYENL